jgi:hypothetical protein
MENARNLKLKPTDFVLRNECSRLAKKSKRQYLNYRSQNEYLKSLNAFFQSKVEVPRMRRGEHQELGTLINEEDFLFAQYLRNERQTWIPRLVEL